MRFAPERLWLAIAVIAIPLLLAAACEDQKKRLPSPNKVLPNSSQLTAALMRAKHQSENEASQARRLLQSRLNDGQNLYAAAAEAHNVAISQMRQALVTPGQPLSADYLRTLLADADAKRADFHNWCSHTYQSENRAGDWGAASGAVDILIDLANLYTEWVKIQEARDQQQRQVILEELDKCRWRSWDEVRRQ